MGINVIDAQLCARMFLAGARKLEKSRDWINELNVFPVPDGDTGTNMTMTIMSAADEVKAIDDMTLKKLSKAMSSGSLRGARGNSGVILSQLLRGFCKAIRDQEGIDVSVICIAFEKAVETAYKAVMKPKEGTILTVARVFAEEATRLFDENPQIEMDPLLAGALLKAEDALAHTPDMLPVLKEAGVVDSGGQGLIEILKGAYEVYSGKEPEEETADGAAAEEPEADPGYCLCFTLCTSLRDEAASALAVFLKEELKAEEGGMVQTDEGNLAVHAHVLHPGLLLEKALSFGNLVRTEMIGLGEAKCRHQELCGLWDSAGMEQEAEENAPGKEEAPAERKETGFVAVAAGEGLCRIFKDLGVDCMIEGGQTMNPSTEDVINAIRGANAKTVFVFPNNKNIILAANQAQSLIHDVKVVVIPTKTVPQGISALISYTPGVSDEENEEIMRGEIGRVQTCSLTYAVRDTHIAGREIHEGDIMGVGDTGILSVGKDIAQTAMEAASVMVTEETELLSIYYGEDVRQKDAEELKKRIQETCPDVEVELNEGGQPVYYYIISAE